MNTFLLVTKLELRKLNATTALKLSVISGLFVPLLYLIYYLTKHETLIPLDGINPWHKFLTDQFSNTAPFLLPILIILQVSLITQIEHSSNGFKNIFVQPIPRSSIYLSKLVVSQLLLILTYVVFALSLFVFGNIIGLVHSSLGFLNFVFPLGLMLKFISSTFIASLGIIGIQFFMSFFIKNFITPLCIGLVLLIAGLIIFRAPESIYFPYCYTIHSLFSNAAGLTWYPRQISIFSCIVFILAVLLGSIFINKKNKY